MRRGMLASIGVIVDRRIREDVRGRVGLLIPGRLNGDPVDPIFFERGKLADDCGEPNTEAV